jgi:hypothetical protein
MRKGKELRNLGHKVKIGAEPGNDRLFPSRTEVLDL